MSAGSLAVGTEASIRVAAHDTRVAGPLQAGDGIFADTEDVGVAEDVGVLAHGGIIAHDLRIAVEHSHQLLAGNYLIGMEQAVVALDDARIGGPADGGCVMAAAFSWRMMVAICPPWMVTERFAPVRGSRL